MFPLLSLSLFFPPSLTKVSQFLFFSNAKVFQGQNTKLLWRLCLTFGLVVLYLTLVSPRPVSGHHLSHLTFFFHRKTFLKQLVVALAVME